jgi:hypothetical protein
VGTALTPPLLAARSTTFTATHFHMIPSQLSEHTRSHRHAEVKHLCAELVLWWVTTGEASVRDCFALLLHHPCVGLGLGLGLGYKAIVLHSHAVLSLWGTSTEKRERRATTLPPEHRRLCEVGHGYGCVHVHTAYQQPRSAVNWFMRSSPPAAGSPRVRSS